VDALAISVHNQWCMGSGTYKKQQFKCILRHKHIFVHLISCHTVNTVFFPEVVNKTKAI